MIHKVWVRNTIIAALVIFFIFLAVVMRAVLAPVFVALAIAYIGDPVIDRFERWKISRTWGIVILIAIITLLLTGLSLYLIPQLMKELQALSAKLPGYWEKLRDLLLPQLQTYAEEHREEVENWKNNALAWLQENAGLLLKSLTSGLATSFRSIGAFFGNLLSLLIIPVLAFYLLRDFDIMTAKMVDLIPIKRRKFVVHLFRDLDRALGNFIKGQLLVAMILSVIYSIGLTIAGCPASLLIGIIAGFANLIPYLGIALGIVPAVLLTYLSGNPTWQILLSGLTFVIGQMLEGMVITPKVVGESVGLHPVVVMVGLTIGGTYFGFVGMILALPTTAVVMVLLRRLYLYYIGSILYHDGESLSGTDPLPCPETSVPDNSKKPNKAKNKTSRDAPSE